MNKQAFLWKVTDTISHYIKNDEVCKYIAAQCALESNFGYSRLATQYNNITGMKMPKIRYTTASYEAEKQFAGYDDKWHSLLDLLYWLIWNKATNKDLSNIENYKTFITKHNYCTDKDYTERIDTIYNQYFNTI